ncbi:AGC family protein kinase [Tritrichomonas foetus]|uniref:non-specific serine/threonine protein kinase n=1 Tax=Tritrichomonas foetus TaxID=1144522 RepID=A0A1J4L1D6_9EUKA|nr:AGC family protein kinase [Tritrichomonas foetus]|eukprot:OHT17329.1 AGC family protein kinase [Tritrichomonas foetus]
MEYLPGGDLYSLLQNVSAIEEDSAKIYTFQIAKALGYLHSRGIIHRDIKPDNILIAADGSLRLTDFGLSYIGCVDRQVSEKPSSNDKIVEAKSLVGTPDYIAPEIILNLSHSFTVDWWSLGIMVYEFIMGIPPFHGKTIDETKDLILKGDYIKPNIENPDISDDCADFIDSLLQQNPHKRLGNNGLEEVLNHKWLKSLSNIDNLQSPFIPELANDLDTSYFEERYSPNGSDDSDIFEDIRREEKQHYSRHSSSPKQVGNSSFLASLSDADGDDNNFDSDMNNFPSVSVEQLMNTNRIISKSHVRGRSSSFMTQEDSSNTSSDSPIVSKSFMGLNPAAGSRRKKTISSFGQYYASANDLKNLILSAKIKK